MFLDILGISVFVALLVMLIGLSQTILLLFLLVLATLAILWVARSL